MNVVLAPFRELVRRRLWPVALLLLAAAVAAPLYLADKEGTSAPVPPQGAAGDDRFASTPIVAAAGSEPTERRRVLGAPKDPFTPSGVQPKPAKAVKPPKSVTKGTAGTPAAGGTKGAGKGGGATGGSPAPKPVSPAPVTPPAPVAPTTPPLEVYSLRVLVDGVEETLARLAPLPNAENPAVIYLGLLEDGKTAVFLLDAGVTADGDGTCHPRPSDCQRLYLKKGETEFFSFKGEEGEEGATDGEFQLDLVQISARKAPSSDRAQASYARASAAGRRALRSRIGRVGRLRYDTRTGKLRRVSVKAWRASVARASLVKSSGW